MVITILAKVIILCYKKLLPVKPWTISFLQQTQFTPLMSIYLFFRDAEKFDKIS